MTWKIGYCDGAGLHVLGSASAVPRRAASASRVIGNAAAASRLIRGRARSTMSGAKHVDDWEALRATEHMDEFNAYMKKHRIHALFTDVIEELLVSKPKKRSTT